MKYSITILFVYLLFQGANAQDTFSKRFHLNTVASLITGVSVTDSSYYAVGVYIDTLWGITDGNHFSKFDLEGNIEFTKFFVDSLKS